MPLNSKWMTAGLWILLVVGGCATPSQRAAEPVDVLLDAPLDHVRAAVLQVLSKEGYPVHEGLGDDRVVITGYRRETGNLWDWLLTLRFGVGRSKVEATLSPGSQQTTRLTISVLYQAKDHIWSTWEDAIPPPHRDASLHVRSVKKELGLL